MSTTVLGISAFYHDAAAAIVRDGEIVAAAQEERFTRRKHDPRFPSHAINYCLEEAFVETSELDAVVFYDNPVLTVDRVLKNSLMVAPLGEDQWVKAARAMLGVKANVKQYVERELGVAARLLIVDHHMSHAASAFYPSPFDEAAVLTVDGVGEWTTTAIGYGRGVELEFLKEIHYPHSLGLLYSAFTSFCGFKVNSGEYKLMGLAPYGEPVYAGAIRDHLIDIREDGSYRLNLSYFGFLDAETMTNDAFAELFGGPPRLPESRITRREMNLAASIQAVLEDAMLGLARHARSQTGSRNLVLAGGVALNCVANGKILRDGMFDDVWIQPAAGDAGGSLGAALLASHRYFDVPRGPSRPGRDRQQGSYLGPAFSSREVRALLDRCGYPYKYVPNPDIRARIVAEALAAGKIAGYMAGRMEFGPRALGARSILGDPRRTDTQSVMNLKIKFRESFRPFAPAVLAERAGEYFEIDRESPYMLLVAPVRAERLVSNGLSGVDMPDDDMLTAINQVRSDIPAVTHVDCSARVQTVNADDHADFHRVLRSFEEITGCAVVVNTSFNVRGEPIVCTPEDAYRCFMRSDIDVLVLEDCVLRKSEQPPFRDTADWRHDYALD